MLILKEQICRKTRTRSIVGTKKLVEGLVYAEKLMYSRSRELPGRSERS